MFSGGKGGHCPPFWHIIFTDQKGGRGFEPPQSFVPQQKLIANAGKRRKTPKNAGKRRKTPENAEKRRKTPQNTAKRRKTPQTRIAKLLRHKKDDGGGGVNDGDAADDDNNNDDNGEDDWDGESDGGRRRRHDNGSGGGVTHKAAWGYTPPLSWRQLRNDGDSGDDDGGRAVVANSPQNAGKHRKTRENAGKRRKYRELGISFA
jgi:hypothetical protein